MKQCWLLVNRVGSNFVWICKVKPKFENGDWVYYRDSYAITVNFETGEITSDKLYFDELPIGYTWTQKVSEKEIKNIEIPIWLRDKFIIIEKYSSGNYSILEEGDANEFENHVINFWK